MWRGAISERRPAWRRLAVLFFAVALALQVAWRASEPLSEPRPAPIPPPPPAAVLRASSLGEPVALAGVLGLWLQALDGSDTPLAALDYARLEDWLGLLLALDPGADTPLLLASHVYVAVPDPEKKRRMLDFTYRAFFADPARRWRWLAHAALVAKHELADLPLALRYARAVAQYATAPSVPHWARQMPIFILEDMGKLEAARIELGAWLATGSVTDPAERHFLIQRLLELERRAAENSTLPSKTRRTP